MNTNVDNLKIVSNESNSYMPPGNLITNVTPINMNEVKQIADQKDTVR